MNAVLVLLILNVVLLSAALIVLIVGFAVSARRLSEKITQITVATQDVRDAVVSTVATARQLMSSADALMTDVKGRLERIDTLAEQVERALAVKNIAVAAGKALISPKITLVSIMEGLREGAKALWGHKNESKEEPINEQ
jgi:uncharacterized protein YoxC